jgi:hypothetical protein
LKGLKKSTKEKVARIISGSALPVTDELDCWHDGKEELIPTREEVKKSRSEESDFIDGAPMHRTSPSASN